MHYGTATRCLLAIVFTHIRGRSFLSTHKPKLTEDGTKECFLNYYLNGDICTECPAGYYEENCSLLCPPPTYGSQCAEQCFCSNASCHHVYGCNETAECPAGYYGDNCSFSCPAPTYGDGCAETCTCSYASCHHVHGCIMTIECPAGYLGDNCSSSCPPPTYGYGCAEHCSCSHASCHHVHGCNITIECRDVYGGLQNCSEPYLTPNHGTPCQVYDCSNSSCHSLYGCNTNASNEDEKEESYKKHLIVSKYIKISIITLGILTLTSLLLLITRRSYKRCRLSAPRGNHKNTTDTPDVDNIYNEIMEL